MFERSERIAIYGILCILSVGFLLIAAATGGTSAAFGGLLVSTLGLWYEFTEEEESEDESST